MGVVVYRKITLAQFLKLSNEYELAAICDIDESVLELHKAEYNVPGYLSMDDMLENEELDLVTLCTPSGIHASQAIKAAKAGVHVITEKPMATNGKMDWQWSGRVMKQEYVFLLLSKIGVIQHYNYLSVL